jgi:hypothetical protein
LGKNHSIHPEWILVISEPFSPTGQEAKIMLARYDNLCDLLVPVQFERKIHFCLVNSMTYILYGQFAGKREKVYAPEQIDHVTPR